MTLKLGELEKLFGDIKSIINYVDKTSLCSNESLLFLSNGEIIQYKIPKDSIAHLLGINIEYLQQKKLFMSENYYDILNELISNPYKIHTCNKDGTLNYSMLFSPYMKEKIECFKENIKPNVNDTKFVCKYDSSRTYTYTSKNQKYNYIIIKGTTDQRYMALCLVKRLNYYVPMSSQTFDTKEDLNKFLEENITNQEITLLRQVSIRNIDTAYNNKFFLSTENILKKLRDIKDYKTRFNCIIDTTGALEYYLTGANKIRNVNNSISDLSNKIFECFTSGELIDIEEYDIPENSPIREIVAAINDALLVSSIGSDKISLKYSELIGELNQLRNTVEQLKFEKEEIQKSLAEKEEKIIKLETKNDEYKATKERILKLLLKPE